MRYEFIIYECTEYGKIKQFEMFHIRGYADVLEALEKVIAPSLVKNCFGDHTMREVRQIPGTKIIIPSALQQLLDPVKTGNAVYVDMIKKINSHRGASVIMNKNGGYQTYNPELLKEIGWKELRREQREKLSFKNLND